MRGLGIDLGADRVRLALLEASGRNVQILATTSTPLPDEVEARGQALRAAVESITRGGRVDRIATALPGHLVSLRILSLPFSDARRLASTVPFEVESLVPFDLEDSLVSFVRLPSPDAPQTSDTSSVLAGVARRSDVEAHLAELRTAGIEPAVVDVGAAALVGLILAPGRDLLLVEPRPDGAVALMRGGRLVGLRVLDPPLDAVLAEECRWSALALADGAPLPSTSLTDDAAAEAARAALARDVAEFTPLARTLPTWATAAAAGFVRAAALASRAAGVTTVGLDFRTGPLAFHAPRDETRRQLRLLGTIAAAVVFLLGTSFAAHVAEHRAELDALRDEIARTTANVLPGTARGEERVKLEGKIDTLRARLELLGGSAEGRPAAVETLRTMGEALPPNLAVQIDDVALDDDGVRLHGRTSSYESVDAVKRALSAAPRVREVEVKDVKTAVDGKVEFRMQFGWARAGAAPAAPGGPRPATSGRSGPAPGPGGVAGAPLAAAPAGSGRSDGAVR